MQSHLCPAMDPILVQPHITRPLPPASALGVCPNQTPTLLSTQITTCSSPLWTLPTPHPPPRPIKEAAPGPQTGFFCPHQPFQLVPTPTRYPAVLALWGSFLTPVCTHWSLCSEPGSSAQDTEGRWKKGPAIPSFSSRGRPALHLPTALSGYT